MSVLRQAFNATILKQSRTASLKRLGTPDIFSSSRIAPSNYFRFLDGPASTTIHGREFVIAVDLTSGQGAQKVSFTAVPTVGGFHLSYGLDSTTPFAFNAVAADIQSGLRALTGLGSVTVSGDFTNGFLVAFIGVDSPVLLTAAQESTPLDASITVDFETGIPWSPFLKKGDKILDSIYGSQVIKEIVEMPDIGGSIMGYRVRCE